MSATSCSTSTSTAGPDVFHPRRRSRSFKWKTKPGSRAAAQDLEYVALRRALCGAPRCGMVRTQGTRATPRRVNSAQIASAPNSPQGLVFFSSRGIFNTKSSVARGVRLAPGLRPGSLSLKSTRSSRFLPAQSTQYWTVFSLTLELLATDLLDAPCRTALTISRRLRSLTDFFTQLRSSNSFFRSFCITPHPQVTNECCYLPHYASGQDLLRPHPDLMLSLNNGSKKAIILPKGEGNHDCTKEGT